MSKIRPRKHERVIHLREVTFHAEGRGTPARGHTIDLSLGGVRLFTERTIAVGDPIDLTWPGREPALTLRGWVVYVKVDADGTSGGILFHRPITLEIFHELSHS